jgi:hypothetical protein
MNEKTLSELPKAEIRFIEPMYAMLVDKLAAKPGMALRSQVRRLPLSCWQGFDRGDALV